MINTYRRSGRWRQWMASFNSGILVQIKLHKNLLIQHFNQDHSLMHINYYWYKKAVLSQRWPRNAPYRPTGVPWKFSGIPDYAHGYYSQHFSWVFVRIDSMNVPTKFEVRSFTRSWDNRGYPKNLGTPRIRPRSLFSEIFNKLLFGLSL